MTRLKITPHELERAIFIDYEGNIDREPTLLGWRLDGITQAAIVETEFGTCADRYRAKGIYLKDHRSLCKELLSLAHDEERVIVSWSEHDLRVMCDVLSAGEVAALTLLYRNAITTARSWHYKSTARRAPAGDLAYFNQLLGFPVPLKYGPGKVGQGLRLIRSQLQEGREYADLTPKARASWIAVIKHNDLDLRSMEFVLRAMLQVSTKQSQSSQMSLTFVHAPID